MAGKKQLPPVRFVGPNEGPPMPTEPVTLTGAVESGTRLEELLAMRRILAMHLENENTLARDLAPLMRQLREISKEVESLQTQEAEKQAAEVDGSNGSSDAEWRPQAI